MLQTAHHECTGSSSTANCELHLIVPEMVSHLWSSVEGELSRAMLSHDMDTDSLLTLCEAGDAQLWVIVSPTGGIVFTFATELITHLTGWKTTRITYGAGSNLDAMRMLMPQLEAWAVSQGCNNIEICGRRGWARVFPDYEVALTVFSKEF